MIIIECQYTFTQTPTGPRRERERPEKEITKILRLTVFSYT
jgi:hypothetical protein